MTDRAIRVEWEPVPETDERLLKLHAHWLSICPNGRVSSRKDFKPAAITSLLPFVFLVDVLSGPRNFRFRLAGTAFAPVIGREITGLLIDEVFPPEYNLEVLEGWNVVVGEYGPNWGSGDLWQKERAFIRWQGVILPLRSDGAETKQLLGAAVFTWKNPA
jgi:hypothetical protein